MVDERLLRELLALVPDGWLVDAPRGTAEGPPFRSADEARAAYVQVLTSRLAARETWLQPLERLRRKAADVRSAG